MSPPDSGEPMDKYSSEYSDIRHLFADGPALPQLMAKADSPTVIVYPPTIDWSHMKQRPQQMMEQFSLHGYTVYYCNMTQSKTELCTAVNPNLTIVLNHRYFVKEILPALKKEGKNIVLWVSWSKLCAFLDVYRPDFIIYDYLDDFSAWRAYLKPMAERADVVVTTSGVLREQVGKEFPHKESLFIPNGCDLAHFKPRGKASRPREFSGHRGPVVIYSGAWAKWIDRELVLKIADGFKNALVAVVGVEFGSSVDKSLPNLRYLGCKPYQELPVYLQSSTVCIIPFLLEPVTVATNPIKMYEYLASGKPVISTDIPEARNVPSVHIGRTHEDFLEKLGMILSGRLPFDKEEVYGWLYSNTWEKRFEIAGEMLKNHGF